MKGKV